MNQRIPFVALSVEGEAASSGSQLSDGFEAGARLGFEHRTGSPDWPRSCPEIR